MTSSQRSTQRLAVNGTRLAVDIAGEGPGILFVHGYPLSRAIWEHQVEGLDGWRRIAPDLRGMGESDATEPAGGYSMATYAADLAALLDALNVTDAVLCGLSMGGYVAFEFMRRWPERVRALVLVDTRANADSPDGRKARDTAIVLAQREGAGAIADEMLPKMLSDDTRTSVPEIAEQIRSMMAATPVSGIVGALTAMKHRADSTPLLPTIEVPALVLVGERDLIAPPEEARAMAQAMPRGQVVTVPTAGHLPPVERPEATSEALRAFLRSVSV